MYAFAGSDLTADLHEYQSVPRKEAREFSMVPKKASGNPDGIAAEMKRAIVALAGSRSWSDSRESMIARAARKAGLTFRQARSLYYGETADPKFSVVQKVREAVDREAARREQEQFLAGLRTIEAALADYSRQREALAASVDADSYRPEIHRLGNVIEQLRDALADRGVGAGRTGPGAWE